MLSALDGFAYDIFISYRQKDNKYDGWVTEFVSNLKKELEATFKEDVSIYFDANPHDGLLETHQVSASLEGKLKCLIFIPVISQTYCDPKSFAWEHEFRAFNRLSKADSFGRDIRLANGNVISRILLVKIHELDEDDRILIESELGGPMRSVDFIYRSAGVNRPLRSTEDHPQDNLNKTYYRDQINKVANAVKEIIGGLKRTDGSKGEVFTAPAQETSVPTKFRRQGMAITAVTVMVAIIGIYLFVLPTYNALKDPGSSGVAVLPFRNFTGSEELNYYGVGMASEIRTKLSMSKQFSFISSLQASLSYSDTKKTPKEIGAELEVDYLLSGLYQKAGSRLKVEVELIDAVTGRAVWSLPIETDLEDIFQLQNQIAERVLGQFSRDEKQTGGGGTPTKSVQAYAHYTRGVALAASPPIDGTVTIMHTPAIIQFARAIQLDSGFIDAWAGLIGEEALVHLNEPKDSLKRRIEEHVNYVNRHFPDSWQKKYIQGEFAYRVLHHYDEATALLVDVLRENPDANVHSTLAGIYRRQLKYSLALQHLIKDVDANPAGTMVWKNLRQVLMVMGDDANAMKAGLKTWELSRMKSDALYVLDLAIKAGVALDQYPDELKQSAGKSFELFKLRASRDWKGVKKLALEEKYYDHAVTACFNLGQRDSARYWANVGLTIAPNDVYYRVVAAPDVQHALDFIDKAMAYDNEEAKISERIWAVFAYESFGQDQQATAELIKLNNDFPDFNSYSWLGAPEWDRIKKEYPPFQEAISNLKRKPMPDVSKMMKW